MPPKKRTQPARGGAKAASPEVTSISPVKRAKVAKAAPAASAKTNKKGAAKNGGAVSTFTKRNAICRDSRNYDYEDVDACWDTHEEYSIVAETVTGGKIRIEGSVNGIGPFQETARVAKLFRGASTFNLTLNIKEDSDEAADYYSTIFEDITYKNLVIQFEGAFDHSTFFQSFFPSIIKGRDLSGSKLTLKWECDLPQNLPVIRQTLKLVPKVNQLEMLCCIKEKKGKESWGQIFDDSTLRHLIANSRRAELDKVDNVTAKGVLDTFEEVCKSSEDKFVEFHLKDSLVDEVFEQGESKKEYEMRPSVMHRRLYYPKNERILVEWGNSCMEMTPIVMQRHVQTPSPT